MTTTLLPLALTVAASAVCGLLFIPLILRFCERRGLYDLPASRKVHTHAIPRLGGVAFFPSMLISSFIALSWVNAESHVISVSLWSVYFLLALSLVFFMGVLDDVFGLPPLWKFAIQVVASCALPLSGLYIDNLHGLFGLHEIPFALGLPLTIVVMTFICNALNLMDGIDGLAASLSLVALTGFLFFFLSRGLTAYALMIAGLLGVLLAFLRFNVWGDERRHTKIFMGDSGSLVLGFVLAFLCVKCSMSGSVTPGVGPFSFAMAHTLVLVPMMDAARVACVRVYHHASPFKADKRHIHHKLLRAGLSQRQTLLLLLALSLVYVGLNYLLLPVCGVTLTLAADVALYVAFDLAVNKRLLTRQG